MNTTLQKLASIKTIPNITSMIGLKVYQGLTGFESIGIVSDVSWNSEGRVEISFEGGCITNMSERELDEFIDEGEVDYIQHHNGYPDSAYSSMFLA